MKKLWIYVAFAGFLIMVASCKKNPTGPAYTATSSDTIAYWTFDGNANDVSGNGHNASFSGTKNYITNRFDSANKAVEVIGAGEMNVQNMPNFSDSDSYSISMWVNFSGGGDLISPNYGFAADTGSFGADLVGCGLLTTKPGPRVDEWHLLTLTVASHNNATLYMDSIQVARKSYGSYSGTNDSMPLSITFNQSGLTSDTARLDDAIFLHHCMSLSEIAARFHEGGWEVHTDSNVHRDTTISSDTGSAFHWSNAYPVPSGILGMSWINGSTGFACGKQGAIWKTTDSGISWQKLNQSITQNDLDAIKFFSDQPKLGFAVGADVIIETTDGGGTWMLDPIPSGIASIRSLVIGIAGFGLGFAVGSDSSGNGVILYENSPYFPTQWGLVRRTPKPLYAIAASSWVYEIPGPDQNHPLVAVGDGGGVFTCTSFKINPDSLIWSDHSFGGSENLRALSIPGDLNDPSLGGVALTDNGSTLWTTDDGVTWAVHSQNVSSYVPNSAVYVASGSEAWISGSHIARTTDNGITWKNEDPVAGQTWTCIAARDANHIGFLSGNGLYWLMR